jgi:V/A-type H+-transporting ATPase subunit A
MIILQEESELTEIVQLIGPDALPERERLTMEVARMIREDYLQQHAFHKMDTYCPLEKQYAMLQIIAQFIDLANQALDKGIGIEAINKLAIKDEIANMKYLANETFADEQKTVAGRLKEQFNSLGE